MRIANHSLLLKPTFMYLLHFAGKGARRRGEVGYSSRNSGTCVWWERVSSSHPANIHLTFCPSAQSSGQNRRHRPQTQRSQVANGPLPCPLTCTSPLLSLLELLRIEDASFPELWVL